MPADATVEYERRQREWSARRDAERRRSILLARLRLATFLPAIAALVWWIGYGGGEPAFVVAAVLLLAFATLVVLHARVEERASWFEALREVNARGTAREMRDWSRLPDAPAPADVDVDGHAYAADLDLFGHASLFQLLGPAATAGGSRTLAAWLLTPAERLVILRRQAAVRELADADRWREHFAAFGAGAGAARGESVAGFLRWAGGTVPALRHLGLVRATVYVLLASMWTLAALHFTGRFPNSTWALLLLIGVVLSFVTARKVSRAFDEAGAGERTLRQHAAVFAHVESQSFTAPQLVELRGRLTSGPGQSACGAMRSLNRILGFAELRHGSALLHFPIQAATLWDFHCLFALERWRRRTGRRAAGWFDAAGEIDALACLATLASDHPRWGFPVLGDDRRVVASALGHPLLPDDRRVPNDVEVGPPGTVLLITGSNMSGKSTLLRAIGVNVVLAQSGAPVCAHSMAVPPCDVRTSIRIQDSLERGVSYFMAALARLKAVVDAAEREPGDRALVYLLDEILQGTNSAERAIAVQAVARHLIDAGAIGAMTTHDLNVASEEPLRSAARLVHFTETVDEQGRMSFDYRLREGLATSRNALRLMQLIGITLK
ncbi:MAG TPA: hypothetical protein VM364_17350 [Vicinamibacterales bacterium]|nr:hypothetical protein [Vicinamibacterales bacterium]